MSDWPSTRAKQEIDGWQSVRTFAAMVAVASLATFLLSILYPSMVSSLPRHMRGEAVLVPWWLCVAGYSAALTLLPWCPSCFVIKTWRNRVLFLLLLVGFALLWNVGLGFDELLSKAWRRGL